MEDIWRGAGMMRADIITEWLSGQGYAPLTDNQLEKMDRYQEFLLETNLKMNLTTITSADDFAVKHFIDSLSLLPWLHDKAKVLDIGSGAGFPGLVIKIARPDLDITLLDSLKKRILFLREAADMLGLKDLTCIHGRAEELSRKAEHRAGYDICTARAVAGLPKLIGYALPFLVRGGIFLAMKGPSFEDEIKEAQPMLKKHGGALTDVRKISISKEIMHTVLVIQKII
jgi:16S rRNA (guanine527-N7)-methyltransferase